MKKRQTFNCCGHHRCLTGIQGIAFRRVQTKLSTPEMKAYVVEFDGYLHLRRVLLERAEKISQVGF